MRITNMKLIITNVERLKIMTTITIDSKSFDDCTIGRLKYKGFQCLTLELPWLGNKPNVSCIPKGLYRARKHVSPHNGDVIEIVDVWDRTHIQVHSGNYTSQILGCILVGDSIKDINNDGVLDVTNSKATLKKLLAVLPNEFQLMIK